MRPIWWYHCTNVDVLRRSSVLVRRSLVDYKLVRYVVCALWLYLFRNQGLVFSAQIGVRLAVTGTLSMYKRTDAVVT
jgi:hypothetical protein